MFPRLDAFTHYSVRVLFSQGELDLSSNAAVDDEVLFTIGSSCIHLRLLFIVLLILLVSVFVCVFNCVGGTWNKVIVSFYHFLARFLFICSGHQ